MVKAGTSSVLYSVVFIWVGIGPTILVWIDYGLVVDPKTPIYLFWNQSDVVIPISFWWRPLWPSFRNLPTVNWWRWWGQTYTQCHSLSMVVTPNHCYLWSISVAFRQVGGEYLQQNCQVDPGVQKHSGESELTLRWYGPVQRINNESPTQAFVVGKVGRQGI